MSTRRHGTPNILTSTINIATIDANELHEC